MIRLRDILNGEIVAQQDENQPIEVLVSPLKVKEVVGNGGQINNETDNVKEIQFDNSTGFHVTDNGEGTVFVELGSSFADIFVEGQTTLEAAGEDKIEFIAGNGIQIATTTTHTGSAQKAITFSSIERGFGIMIIDASDDSSDFPIFEDMINNPLSYKGKVVYITDIGPTERPDPFLWIDKFYFNEGGEWHESPFSFKLD